MDTGRRCGVCKSWHYGSSGWCDHCLDFNRSLADRAGVPMRCGTHDSILDATGSCNKCRLSELKNAYVHALHEDTQAKATAQLIQAHEVPSAVMAPGLICLPQIDKKDVGYITEFKDKMASMSAHILPAGTSVSIEPISVRDYAGASAPGARVPLGNETIDPKGSLARHIDEAFLRPGVYIAKPRQIKGSASGRGQAVESLCQPKPTRNQISPESPWYEIVDGKARVHFPDDPATRDRYDDPREGLPVKRLWNSQRKQRWA